MIKYLRDPVMAEARFRLTFTESILGTSPGNPDIYRDYLQKKMESDAVKNGIPLEKIQKRTAEEAELLDVEGKAERGKTCFPRGEDGRPFLWDYQLKGYFKSACQALKKINGSQSAGVRAFKKLIDTAVFIGERRIPIVFDGEVGECQRPLRASTPQGERVSIAVSEEIPAGAQVEFTVKVFNASDLNLVREWLCYGKYNGLLQWRNGGHGRFLWEELDEDGATIEGNVEGIE